MFFSSQHAAAGGELNPKAMLAVTLVVVTIAAAGWAMGLGRRIAGGLI